MGAVEQNLNQLSYVQEVWEAAIGYSQYSRQGWEIKVYIKGSEGGSKAKIFIPKSEASQTRQRQSAQ